MYLYAAGAPIKLAQYQSWFDEFIMPVTCIPRQKMHFEISDFELIGSFVSNATTFFADNAFAAQWAFQHQKMHKLEETIVLSMPAVFKLEVIKHDDSNTFTVTKILTAHLFNYPERTLNIQADNELKANFFAYTFQNLNPLSTSFLYDPFICKAENFIGNFQDLINAPSTNAAVINNRQTITPLFSSRGEPAATAPGTNLYPSLDDLLPKKKYTHLRPLLEFF